MNELSVISKQINNKHIFIQKQIKLIIQLKLNKQSEKISKFNGQTNFIHKCNKSYFTKQID
jgi:hypothetical protein